jgi:translation initiation factor 2B subunit (eIF-2B alpha/beta/delta family)
VFPFLFELADGIEIKTDWETAEWGWFLPKEVAGLDTVPGLESALDRVWPTFGDSEFWSSLSGIATDTTSGATELARRGLAALGRFVQGHYKEMDRPGILRAVRAFAACRPVMGVFPDLAARLLLAIEREGGEYDLDELITELLNSVEDATRLSGDIAAAYLSDKQRLFTLSYSEAVRNAIMDWKIGEGEVIVAESAPRREGIKLVEYLADHGVNVEIASDSAIPSTIQEVDAILVGCDAITEADDLQNKIGTRITVEAANEAGIPAYAVAQTFKITPSGWPVFLERQAPGDFGEANERPGSPVFDLTPLDRFEAVFTEEGQLTPERLAEIRAELDSVELLPGA